MASNNQKYREEFRAQTAEFIIESVRSAASVAEEMVVLLTSEHLCGIM